MSSYSSSDSEESQDYWNNWRPPSEPAGQTAPREPTKKVNFRTRQSVKSLGIISNNSNWIPPIDFGIRSEKKPAQKQIHTPDRYTCQPGPDTDSQLQTLTKPVLDNNFPKFNFKDKKWEKLVNRDWGERVELHDVSGYCDGETFWGVVPLGTFASIKLWVNNYGNVCALAEGKISKEGSPETSIISISDSVNLRKMLNVTHSQWSSLCELVHMNKLILKFEALANSDESKMTSLEKLWFYMCKRRHFMQDQCMLVKFSGAVKSLKEFKIIPKLIVQNVRDISGSEIS